jgi:hypothetical protein
MSYPRDDKVEVGHILPTTTVDDPIPDIPEENCPALLMNILVPKTGHVLTRGVSADRMVLSSSSYHLILVTARMSIIPQDPDLETITVESCISGSDKGDHDSLSPSTSALKYRSRLAVGQ